MKFNTKLPAVLKPYFEKELKQYQIAFKMNDLPQAWTHLERAHIIGQQYPMEHTYVHWKMLQFGFYIKSTKEVIGQIPRLVFGGIKSFVGKVPIGNPGGAQVSALRSFSVAPDLQSILDRVKE